MKLTEQHDPVPPLTHLPRQVPQRRRGRADARDEEHALAVLGPPLVYADGAVRRRDVAGPGEGALGRIGQGVALGLRHAPQSGRGPGRGDDIVATAAVAYGSIGSPEQHPQPGPE